MRTFTRDERSKSAPDSGLKSGAMLDASAWFNRPSVAAKILPRAPALPSRSFAQSIRLEWPERPPALAPNCFGPRTAFHLSRARAPLAPSPDAQANSRQWWSLAQELIRRPERHSFQPKLRQQWLAQRARSLRLRPREFPAELFLHRCRQDSVDLLLHLRFPAPPRSGRPAKIAGGAKNNRRPRGLAASPPPIRVAMRQSHRIPWQIRAPTAWR